MICQWGLEYQTSPLYSKNRIVCRVNRHTVGILILNLSGSVLKLLKMKWPSNHFNFENFLCRFWYLKQPFVLPASFNHQKSEHIQFSYCNQSGGLGIHSLNTGIFNAWYSEVSIIQILIVFVLIVSFLK